MTEKNRKRASVVRSFTTLSDLGETRGLNEERRSIDFIASTETEDDHGTVIDQSWDLSRYRRNSVVLYAHNAEAGGMFGGGTPGDSIPIARAENVRVEDDQLKCTVVFPVEGEDALSDRVWRAIVSKRLNAMSVGFKPGKVKREELPEGRTRLRLSNNVLFELSICAMGSNPDAVAERSLLSRMADREDGEGCSDDGCGGPEDCEDDLCECACHGARTNKGSASTETTETHMDLETLARSLGCPATEGDVLAALEALKTRAAEPKAEAVAGEILAVTSFDEERAVFVARIAELDDGIATQRANLREVLGLTVDATHGDVTKALVHLQSRATKADELEPVVATLTGEVAKLEGDVAVREVDFLIKRGKHYGLSLDERSRKALAAYRKADPKGFAEDYKPALDGLRAFDESELFERVAPPVATSVVVTPDAADDRAEFDRRVAAYRTKHDCLESVAIDAVMRGRDIG